jgi:casein kinase I family protein HRR25
MKKTKKSRPTPKKRLNVIKLQPLSEHQYALKKKIGYGSFGKVFLACHKVRKNFVAIKLEYKSKKRRGTLSREAEIMYTLKGLKGIPTIHCFLSVQKFHAIVMD